MPPTNKLVQKFNSQPKQPRANSTPITLNLVVPIPADVFSLYDVQAEREGKDVGVVAANRLIRTVDYTAQKPLYFNDAQRQRLERALDTNFKTADEVIARVERLVELLSINGGEAPVTISLTPQMIERISGQCHYGIPFSEKLREFAMYGIRMNTGLS
jgi:hypothetical protein